MELRRRPKKNGQKIREDVRSRSLERWSVVRSAYCSCRPTLWLKPPVTPVLGGLMSSSGLLKHPPPFMVHINSLRHTHIHLHKISIFFKTRSQIISVSK